jgi:radical SAM PhpK family P-methyltransferase
MVRSMGTDSGAYKDLDLSFIEYENKPYRAMDILNHFHFEEKENYRPFHYADFVWPVTSYLGSYLTKRGFSFDYINLFHMEKDKLREKLLNDDVLTVAVTTTLYVMPAPILEIICFIRRYNERVKIIVGGPYIANTAKNADRVALEQQYKAMGADFYVISSEGEAALVNILRALKTGASFDDVDNIAYLNGKSYMLTAASIESNRLEENLVDYTLIPQSEYGEFVSTRTAKSCPFSCSFCNFPQQAGKYKYTGVELVEHELNAIREIGGVTTLTFIDDTFNVPKQRFKEMLQMMIRNKYEFKWNCNYRCDHGDEEIINLMARAGCEGVFMGVESGSNKMLKIMNKTATREDYLKYIPMLRDVGILAHANLFIGFPGETYETVQESIDLVKEARPVTFSFQLWYANPLTPIWNRREEFGIQGASFNWSHNTMDAETAIDLIDKIFLTVDESVFLPQYGFFQWCLFYLQRKGMSLDQIKTFLRAFNKITRERMIHPSRKEIDPRLLENLKRSCQFDRPAQPVPEYLEIFSSAGYFAAQEFCVEEFAGVPPTSSIEMLRDGSEPAEATSSSPRILSSSLVTRLEERVGASISDILLAAYSAVLWRLNGLEEVVVVAAHDGDAGESGVAPLRLAPTVEMSFTSLVEAVRSKRLRALPHQSHSFVILTNRLRLRELGLSLPVFDVGYLFRQSGEGELSPSVAETLNDYPQISRQSLLTLDAVAGEQGVVVNFRSRLAFEVVEKLGTYLQALLEGVAQSPESRLVDLALEDEELVTTGLPSTLQSKLHVEDFDF